MAEPPASEVAEHVDASDAELAALVARGATEAEAELCARFAPRVRSYGRRHLRSDDAASELVQRVLLVVLEKLRAGAVREPERIASFVLGTARVITLETRRRAARERSEEDALESVAAPAAGGCDFVAPGHLARCFDALGDRERDTLIATYYSEQPSEQIARALGVSCDNVRQIRRRAVARLRECLGVGQELFA